MKRKKEKERASKPEERTADLRGARAAEVRRQQRAREEQARQRRRALLGYEAVSTSLWARRG